MELDEIQEMVLGIETRLAGALENKVQVPIISSLIERCQLQNYFPGGFSFLQTLLILLLNPSFARSVTLSFVTQQGAAFIQSCSLALSWLRAGVNFMQEFPELSHRICIL